VSFISPVTNVLYTAVSWVLLRWHQLFSAIGMDKDSGLTWALSIVFLVITARLLLFRFFIKQVHYQRHMQELQPQIQKLRDKHKGDRQRLQQEMMKLQQEQGFNPLAGCAPMLLQIPVFLGLFHVLRHLSHAASPSASDRTLTLYGFSRSETLSAARAKLFDAPLAASFHDSKSKIEGILHGTQGKTQIVIAILTVISAAATYMTQRQAQRNATTAPTGQAAMIQKVMLYLIPLFVLGSGFVLAFPLGVIIYWFTSNLWTMLQQFYIYKYHPVTPGAKVPAAVAETTRSSAPRPGAKPVRQRSGGSSAPTTVRPDDTTERSGSAKATAPKTGAGKSGSVPPDEVAETADGPVRSSRPKPGARPPGNRPNTKRSGQRSKRR
jgi:YidC/Oxa1 family membrane protein insertase